MNFRLLLSAAALVAIIAVIAIGYVLIPGQLQTPVLFSSLALFACAVGLLIVSPLMLHPATAENDAGRIASIGPRGTIVALTLVGSAIALALALARYDRVSWAMIIATICGFVIATFAIAKVPELVDQAAERTSSASGRTLWRAQIQSLIPVAKDTDTVQRLRNLYEQLEFAASGHANAKVNFDDEIGESISAIKLLISGSDTDNSKVAMAIGRVTSLLDQREAYLRAARSKA